MSRFDAYELEEYVPFVVTKGFVLSDVGETAEALHVINRLRRMHWTGPLPHGFATLDSALHDLAGMSVEGSDRATAGDLKRVVDRDEMGTGGAFELLLRFSVAFSLYTDGDLGGAQREADDILRGHLAVGRDSTADQTATVLSTDLLALISYDRGDAAAADEQLVHAAQLLESYEFDELHFRAAQVHDLTTAVLAPDSEDRARSLQHVVSEATNVGPRFHALIELCRQHDRAGDVNNALAALAHAVTMATDIAPEPLYAERIRRLRIAVDASVLPVPIVTSITPGERAVLKLLPSDLTQTDIGALLGLSVNTVKSHLRSIYQKIGVSSRAEAVAYGIELGLLCTVVPWEASAGSPVHV